MQTSETLDAAIVRKPFSLFRGTYGFIVAARNRPNKSNVSLTKDLINADSLKATKRVASRGSLRDWLPNRLTSSMIFKNVARQTPQRASRLIRR